ncbi:MAG TPA: hypothetical protein ENK16_03355 [Chromatiales bacterium]|nr:hypothetical protein [Chromatiales bacterium]
MKTRDRTRDTRFGVLPTAVLTLALGAGFAPVGQAETITQTMTVTAPAAECVKAEDLRQAMQATARDAVWRTRIRVATDLSVRLNSQHRPFRLASREQGKRG